MPVKQRPSPYLDIKIKGLAGWDYDTTSEPSDTYNCIAWAVGDNERWWEPGDDYYWPKGAPHDYSLEALVKAYELMGYERCLDDSYDPAYEKIAISSDPHQGWHAARQIDDIYWASKLGRAHDIEHPLHALDDEYGPPKVFMRKAR